MTTTVGVLGAGAWGTALGIVAAAKGHRITLWARDGAHAEALSRDRENGRDLPGVRLPKEISASGNLEALGECDLVLAAVPAQALRGVLGGFSRFQAPGGTVLVCAKGLERSTGHDLCAVARGVLPAAQVAILSGPSFAGDVARGLPTAVTVAAATRKDAADIAERLATPAFRIYHTDDVLGVAIGGAVKNVLAIACGIARGRELGGSASAALISRAFAELLRFGKAIGARPATLMGLSGFGDLVLTCNSPQSRNFSFGVALGRGVTLQHASAQGLAEGVATAPVLVEKARALGVSMPIAESVAAVLGGGLSIDAAIAALVARPATGEG